MARSLELIGEESRAGARAARAARGERAWALEGAAALALALLFAFGLALRAGGLGEVGFAEDEINKLEAVRAYGRGDITPNAEHPMLMKALIFVSMRAAGWWNAGARDEALRIGEEAALRLPNALFGALTVLPLFLLTAALFDRRTGLVAAALWAFGVNAITFNRVGKEDTLLVFFMLFAFYFYLRAKQTSGFAPRRKHRFYTGAAVAFGLMLASKYFPHYFGLNMLYHHLVAQRRREPNEPRGRTPAFFYPLVFVAFFVANPVVLLPQTWHYLTAYSSEQLLTHTGYLMGDTLYSNQMSSTPFGMPIYFYLLFLAVKTPLPLLVALAVGLAACARRWREPGPAFLLLMFVLWIVPYSLAGAKWLRYALSLMPFVYMLAAVGIMAALRWSASSLPRGASLLSPARLAGAALLFVFVALPAWSAYASRPHFALYTNALGAGRAGYFFPHDEFYDDGLREAIKFVCDTAPRGATLVHETPGVVRYYTEKFNRADLQSRVLSAADFKLEDAPPDSHLVLQRGRTYFENRRKMDQVRARFRKVHEVFVGGVSAVEVYVKG